MSNDIAVSFCVHDDWYFLSNAVKSFASAGPVYVFVSDSAWSNAEAGDSEKTAEVAEAAGAIVVRGSWQTEAESRAFAVDYCRTLSFRWMFVADGDEIIERVLLDNVAKLARTGLYDMVRVRMFTYWKSVRYRIEPMENLAPIILIDLETCEHTHIREYSGITCATLDIKHGVIHHLSYVDDPSHTRILRKITCWSHSAEVYEAWYESVWLAWDRDRMMRNLHPTHPECYSQAHRVKVPEILKGIEDGYPALPEPPLPEDWVPQSVVVPLYGGPDHFRACLESIEKCGVIGWCRKPCKVAGKRTGKLMNAKGVPSVHLGDRPALFREVIVVDDCSPDDAAEVVKDFPFVRFYKNDENVGFGQTCNRGIELAQSEHILLLNSDNVVTRAGIIRMGECMSSSGIVGAVAPLTNNAGYYQAINPAYTDIRNLERFACDFAHRAARDVDRSMVVGFCLLVRKSVLKEVGLFDSRYGRALFEDTDLVLRIQIAGYSARIAERAYIHHEGSRSLARMGEHPSLTLARNKKVFEATWRLALDSGYLPYLPGQKPERIQVNPDRDPEVVLAQLREHAKREKISVCIIARNEARVIRDCLGSLLGVFDEVIVQDTGSDDETMDYARELGAKVFQMEWQDSFSIARNMSIKHATGRWVLWVDCDDTVPFQTLEAMVMAIVNAPKHVSAFVVPVQFVESTPGTGTSVDHVKIFRNSPHHFFEGRIHENVLPSIRAAGGEVLRIPYPVLHSGYDSSPEGQRKKRIRDRKLLGLDLKDRPGHPFCLFNLGMTAFYSGRFRVAIGWLRRSLAASNPGDSHVRKVFVLHALALQSLGKVDEAIQVMQRGLNVLEDPELHYNLANLLHKLGRHQEAHGHLLAMNTDTSGFFSSLDISILGWKRFVLLGSVCLGMGQELAGKNYLREAIKANPANPECAALLFEAAQRTGDIIAAREASEAMLTAAGPGENWAQMRTAIVEMGGGNADQELANLTHMLPQATGPALVLSRRILSAGHPARAIPLLIHLENLGCAEGAHHLGTFELHRGDLDAALYHTELSLQLDPSSQAALLQLNRIEGAKEDLALAGAPPDSEPLKGPHVGKLGPATCARSVVIVTFNSEKYVRECVSRVLPQLGETDELIVVDNASTDKTLEVVAQFESDPRVRLLPQTRNLGYSAGCNVGTLASGGASIVWLNPDGFVYDGWLNGLEAALGEGFAAVGPVSDYIAGEQFAGIYARGGLMQPDQLAATLAAQQTGVVRQTKLLMGVCMMLSREILDKHGLLFEGTECGADDLEISWRLQELGYKLGVATSVFVRQVGGASFATLPHVESRRKILKSDRALVRRLRAYYGDKPIPSSVEIWGCNIFAEALSR